VSNVKQVKRRALSASKSNSAKLHNAEAAQVLVKNGSKWKSNALQMFLHVGENLGAFWYQLTNRTQKRSIC
jgi:hypothetical protein